mmetsp:Transcript_25095/g.41566  ORF Transcript_25095/g.41566 Transcript_25095/m.41566 type:complete len:134 (-) Transcript_25095:792-1193(-)
MWCDWGVVMCGAVGFYMVLCGGVAACGGMRQHGGDVVAVRWQCGNDGGLVANDGRVVAVEESVWLGVLLCLTPLHNATNRNTPLNRYVATNRHKHNIPQHTARHHQTTPDTDIQPNIATHHHSARAMSPVLTV